MYLPGTYKKLQALHRSPHIFYHFFYLSIVILSSSLNLNIENERKPSRNILLLEASSNILQSTRTKVGTYSNRWHVIRVNTATNLLFSILLRIRYVSLEHVQWNKMPSASPILSLRVPLLQSDIFLFIFIIVGNELIDWYLCILNLHYIVLFNTHNIRTTFYQSFHSLQTNRSSLLFTLIIMQTWKRKEKINVIIRYLMYLYIVR